MTEQQKLDKLVDKFLKENNLIPSNTNEEVNTKDLFNVIKRNGQVIKNVKFQPNGKDFYIDNDKTGGRSLGKIEDGDRVETVNKVDEAKPKGKINPKYTHFALRKSNNKIVNGWEYKDLDPQSIAEYVRMDLKDMDIKPSEVSVLTTKGIKAKNIDPFDSDNWEKLEVDEDTVIATNTGDQSSATTDQKKKIQNATAKGDAVKIIKKGTTITENEELSLQESTGIKSVIDKVTAAHDELEKLAGTIQDNKYQKYATSAMKHLENAESVLGDIHLREQALSEEAAEADKKMGDKYVKDLQKHLSKKFKNKDDVSQIMKKYDQVARKLKDKEPEKVSEAIWKHFLNESAEDSEFSKKHEKARKSLKELHSVLVKHNFVKK